MVICEWDLLHDFVVICAMGFVVLVVVSLN